MKDSYIMHCDYDNHFELLTNEELGRLIRDINNYVKNGVLPQYSEEDRVLNMAFSFMKTNIDIETEKYIKKCEKNKENGRRGGRPKKSKEENPKKANGFEENPTKTKKADTDTDTTTDTDTDTTTDTDINNSVCNKKRKNICHLGSDYKSESCFYCMKKEKCLNPESTDFKLKHPDETFIEWDKRKTKDMKKTIKIMEARGQPLEPEVFDYNWLEN